MIEMRVKVLENIHDVADLGRADVIIAKIGSEGPAYAACIEKPTNQLRLLIHNPRGDGSSLLELPFDLRGDDVQVGSLGGLKKTKGVNAILYDRRHKNYEDMQILAEEAGIW